ncbi:SDR family NAD(P)-dependent oxidoreductase [Halalkalibacter oceani]|uniref:SDR family NAD(P)-dependent oxidoreductase n=1 Tax=Halalkalibacter oceani TaxID=1653776 RepID=UPI003395DC42
MANLKGKVALVTGAAHPLGIGRSIAEYLGKEGAEILIGDIDQRHMEQAVKDFADLGIKATCYDMDVSQLSEVEKTIEAMMKQTNGIDILINNVGGTSRISRSELGEETDQKRSDYLSISNATVEQWNRILNVNLNSAFYCSKAVLPSMKKRRFGKIINFTSVAGQRGVLKAETFTSGPYAVAKSAIIGLTRQLALETAEYGIQVNAVSPGYVRSARGQALDQLPKEQYDALISSVPQNRFAEPEEVAGVVLSLCTDSFKYVTGQTININGGMYFN